MGKYPANEALYDIEESIQQQYESTFTPEEIMEMIISIVKTYQGAE